MERDPVKETAPINLTDLFDEVFPWYLTAGMTPEQFWDGDPWLAKAYRKKLELADRKKNEEAWLYGKYVFYAVSTALYNGFRGKGKQSVEYLKEPFKIAEKETEATKAAKKEKAMNDSIAFIEGMAKRKKRRKDNADGNNS